MKRIGLISDTHGNLHERVNFHFKDCDEIWHAGDIGSVQIIDELKKIAPLKAVYGNIDGAEIRNNFPGFLQFSYEGLNVLMTHIGGYPGRYAKGIANLFKSFNPDLFISGHSHILKVMYDKKNNLLHINPGAAGNSGFHQVRTLVKFEINNKNIQNLEVIELCKRG